MAHKQLRLSLAILSMLKSKGARRLWVPVALAALAAGTARAATAPFELLIKDADAFSRLQRTYHSGPLNEMPHVLFMVDRASHKVYFAASRQFDFHESFARSLGMVQASSKEFFRQNYTNPKRPLIMGTLVWLPGKKAYFFEFAEADRLTPALVSEAYETLKANFYAPLAFKPNSLAHEQVRLELRDGVPSKPLDVFQTFSSRASEEIFRPGRSTGVLRFVRNIETGASWPPLSIVVMNEAPVQIVPLNGLVTTQASSPLSHIHMLARTWKVPDVRLAGAWEKWKHLQGQWVTLDARPKVGITLRPAKASEINQATLSLAKRKNAVLPGADLGYRELPLLADQKKEDVKRVGAKSSNLGEVARLKSLWVPPGFSIPFAYYAEHFKFSGAEALARAMMAQPDFSGSDEVKKTRLAELRALLQKTPLAPAFEKSVLDRYRAVLPGAGVFVRSSTNAEDLPGFNGAGLYSSVPNVRSEAMLLEGIKTVWASVWNFEAFKAREQAGMDHFQVFAGVLVQRGVDAESAGVMITRNPFKADDRRSVYINAKKGIGIKVVNGMKVPEQVLFNAATGAATLLSRSEEATFLAFDEKGGLKEVSLGTPQAPVLTDALVKDLAAAARRIEKHFNGVPQDIEWLVEKNKVWIVQSRPYPDN